MDLVPNYKDIFEDLKDKPYNTVDGVHYGVPHGRGANLLMSARAVGHHGARHWADVFDAGLAVKGKVTVYNYAIYIADAALS